MPQAGRHGTSVNLLTIKLDCSSPGSQERYYSELLDWLKLRVVEKEIIR